MASDIRPPRDCKHGQLARSCEICERDDEIASLRARIAELEALRDDHWRMQGEAHASPCTYGSLCPWCRIAELEAQRDGAVKGRAEFLQMYREALVKLRQLDAAFEALYEQTSARDLATVLRVDEKDKRIAELEAEREQDAREARKWLDDHHEHDMLCGLVCGTEDHCTCWLQPLERIAARAEGKL